MIEKEMTELHHVLLHVRFLGFQIYIILGLILSAQLVWEECWVRFLTSGLTHKACAGIFVSPAQGTFQSCVSQPSLLDLFSAFSSQSGLCSDAPREGAALSVSSSLTGLPFCLKSWIVAA